MTITTFLIHGWGWRSRQFATIARALPDRFRCVGVLRREDRGDCGDLPVFTDFARAAAVDADFTLISVPRSTVAAAITAWAARGRPALAETPPAADAEGLLRLWAELGATARVQVAEQYPLMPFHQAVSACIASGRIGTPTQVDCSLAHGYHGMALIRRFLGTGFACPTIRATTHRAAVVAGPGRDGPPARERIDQAGRLIATLDFGDGRLGIQDFDFSQYFSWIRGSHLRIRGTRGEIDDEILRWLIDHVTPMQGRIERREGGSRTNLEGKVLHGYVADGSWCQRNPYIAPLSDDHLAMATVLDHTGAYARGGPGFYGLAEACHDHWLDLHCDHAAAEDRPVLVPTPPWAR